MSRSVTLSPNPSSRPPVEADTIASVFFAFRPRGMTETHIHIRGGDTVSILPSEAHPRDVLDHLKKQDVTLLRQPGQMKTPGNERYIAPHLMDYAQLVAANDAACDMTLGIRGGTKGKTYGVTPDAAEAFFEAARAVGKNLRELGKDGLLDTVRLDSRALVDPATLALLEETPNAVAVYCLDALPFSVGAEPAYADGPGRSVHRAALGLSTMSGRMIELPSTPVVHIDASRVLPPIFSAAHGPLVRDINLRPSTLGTGRTAYRVTFPSEDALDHAGAVLETARRTPSSILPPAR